MSFEINDVGSLILQHSIGKSSGELEKNLVALSAGKKQLAIEDAANLLISEGLESQRRGSAQAAENAQMGMNMLDTAEGGLSSINDNLQRIRELKVQRENGTYGDEERAAIDSEIGALMSEIDRTSENTSFNDINLLDGSSKDVALQIGAGGDSDLDTLSVGGPFDSTSTSALGLDPSSDDFLNQIDDALNTVSGRRSQIGAIHNRLEGTVNSLFVQQENYAAAQSRITDVDIASETSKLTQNQILQNASVSLMAQANQSPSIASILV